MMAVGAPGTTPAPTALRVALIGNPNTGKSTLFNALTGLRQRVGNFAGVTVERVEGGYQMPDGRRVTLVDLPGAYSLAATSPDERIALDVLRGHDGREPRPDVVLVVVDATHLGRNLFLASQICELGLPVVVALNQVDAAAARGITIDVPALIHELGVPIVPTVASRGEGLDPLRRALVTASTLPAPGPRFALDESAETTAARYGWISDVVARTVTQRATSAGSPSDRIDTVALHRLGGPLLFFVVMALVFQAVFSWATPVQDAIEAAVLGVGHTVGQRVPAGDLRSLVVDGVFAGVGSVLVFLPQIALLFAFIGVLEQSGYMARAAFLMDRLMRRVGLNGKSFIPMLSGYACAVPGIMATRTIEDPKDRLATIMVVPLTSCSARLPVYTLLIGAFVPAVPLLPGLDLQGATMLAMYLLGTIVALGIAALFRRTLLRGPVRPMILELPPYRWPSPRSIAVTVWQRSMLFLRRAGTVILALSIVLWALATFPRTTVSPDVAPAVAQETQLANSALGRFGRAIEPAVAPLGYDWKIGVSILASFAAREVFVSTMGTIYGVGDAGESALADALRTERRADGQAAYTPLIAVSLMVFYVFALMCMSTIAVTVREAGGGRIGWRWAAIQFTYMLVLAYGAAWLVLVLGRAMGFA
ncbi:MAG: ferrous iron transport protein B [Gemmatimonadota bacterium]|nr:ferrous iron transport protein B [Gemmatimonadota bacterium]MDQ8146624.1 ferrous iron transport protein B [Gemmatimonadota bacterium]MDQ8148954.1 ferrous iron transport protein B [Gemmatimonadota bacterium]